jgi:hypothetical protein
MAETAFLVLPLVRRRWKPEKNHLTGLKEQEQALTTFIGAVSTCWTELALPTNADEEPALFDGVDSFPMLSKGGNNP